MSNTKTQSIVYPISLNYVPTWDIWEITREIISNAMDTNTKVSIELTDDKDFIIADKGEGLAIKQLLLGVSEKSSDNAIGQFGEGLKLSLLVLSRLGLSCDIYSGNLHLWNGKSTIDNVDVLKVSYKTTSTKYNGTKVIIHNWDYPTFQDRFIFDGNNKPVYQNEKGMILANNSQIYVKNVYVCTDDKFAYSYNLFSVNMNRDRSTVNEYEIKRGIGAIYEQCTDVKIWKKFFEAVKDGKKEKEIEIHSYYMTSEVKESMRAAWESIYGKKTVIATETNKMLDAEHRGAKTIHQSEFGYELRNILKETIGTDETYVKAKLGEKFQRVTSHQIDNTQKKNLAYLRKIAKRVKYNHKLIKVASNDADFNGRFHPATGEIEIREERLEILSNAVSTFVHELGHWYDACLHGSSSDNTDEHMQAVTYLSGLIISGYMDHSL